MWNKRLNSEEDIILNTLNDLRIKILRSLTKCPKTAFALSKELNLSTSTIYRNLDVLGTYGLVQVYRIEPYKHVMKKYYMTTFKAFYAVFEYLKDLSYYFFATIDRYTALRWKVAIYEKYVDEYATISSTPKLVEEEYKLLKQFLRDLPFTLEDLNDIDTFLMFTVYVFKNIKDPELKDLELRKIEILSRFARDNETVYKHLKTRLTYIIEGSKAFLEILENFLRDEKS